MHTALDKGWTALTTGTVKGCKVQILDDGTRAAYRAGLAKTATIYSENNKELIYESAFRTTDTSDPTKVTYYLSQFQDSSKPCAARETRATYTTFVSKAGSTSPATGHACELIDAPVTQSTVQGQCAADPRCAGYYLSTNPKLPPVMATTEPGKCKVEWKLLPDADRPTTADKCKRDTGDLFWFTSGGKCVATCLNNWDTRNDRGLCRVYVSPISCIKNWAVSYASKGGADRVNQPCVPTSEAACPIGWTYQTATAEYPDGQCTK